MTQIYLASFDNKQDEVRARHNQRRRYRKQKADYIRLLITTIELKAMCTKSIGQAEKHNQVDSDTEIDRKRVEQCKRQIEYLKEQILRYHNVLSLKSGVAYY